MRIHPHWLKVGVTAAGGLLVLTAAKLFITPPPLTAVATIKHAVALDNPLTAHDIQWIPMVHPPANAITQPASLKNVVAAHTLQPGQSLVAQDVTLPMHMNGLRPDEVEWLVTLSGANSGVPYLGERVDVWNNPGTGTATELARGVRIMALYTSNGTPINAGTVNTQGNTTANSTNVGIVGLAVPYPVLQTLLPIVKPQLVPDPNVNQFTWIVNTPTTSTPPSSSSSPASGSTAKSAKSTKSSHSATTHTPTHSTTPSSS
jgi:hypothetical protein